MLDNYEPPVHHLDELIHEWGDEYGEYLDRFYNSVHGDEEEPLDFEAFLDDVMGSFDDDDAEVM